MKGFYTQTAWAGQTLPLSTVPLCGVCQLYKHCQSPKMVVDGEGRRKVLILAEGPGQNEDEKGQPLVGAAGLELTRALRGLGVNMRRDCWLTNAIICRPTDEEGNNRSPDPKEIEWCRPNLVKTLKELKPDVVIPMGRWAVHSIIPLAWKDNEVHDVARWIGWQIPSQRLNTWICSTWHPSHMLYSKDSNYYPALDLHWHKHLAAAFALEGKPWQKAPEWDKRVVVVQDSDKAAGIVRELTKAGRPVAVDLETDRLKPDHKDSQIICCSVSDGEVSVAFPWHGQAIVAVRWLLLSNVPKIAANARFEERWFRRHLKVAVNNWKWDTVVASHVLDCRHGINSLKFQAFVRLGMPDYDSHLSSYMAQENSNKPNRLKEVEPAVLYKYCAMDSLLEVLLAQKQAEIMGMKLS